jgi:DNA mismatch repair protein MutS2
LNNHLYQTLEFHKVLEDLARRSHCPVTAERLKGLKPLSSPDLVLESLARISEVRTWMDSGGAFPMDTFDDIGPYLKSLAVAGSRLEPKAFRQIHRVLELSARIHSFLYKNRTDFPLLHEAAAGIAPNPGLAEEITRVIDLGSLEILDRASPTLAAIRHKMARAREQVRRQMEDLLQSLGRKGVLQERLITMRSGRWVLPVKETHRHLVKGVLHDKSASGATVFLEPLVTLELNNQIRRLEAEEYHEIEKILYALTELVRENSSELEHNFAILVTLDGMNAMGLASKALDQHEPAINTDGILEIKNGRHPLLVLKKTPMSDVAPLDLSMGKAFNTLVITGPNAGGKTVALKTVGLLTLMVSCGLHVPADADSQIPLFNRIFAHVGDAQSIEMDLSTFSAHLKEIKAIAEGATSGDLVLIDEIGTGTDPQEGAALAMAVLEALTLRGVVTVVTTHHGALKAFAHQTPGMANGSMAFDAQTLTPTYKFRAHIPGSSYALEIAKRMGLPEGVLARSKAFMGDQANRLEELILRLEEQTQQNKRLEKDLESERLVVHGTRKRLEEQQARFEREADQRRHKAAEEAGAILQQATAAVEKAIKTIRESGAAREGIREARALIQKEKETLKKEMATTTFQQELCGEERIPDAFRPGNRVNWKRTGMAGTVLSDEDQTGRVLTAFGKLKAHVPREELSLAEDVGESLADRVLQVEMPVPERVRPEADMRGMRVAEALEVVDKYLDDALLAGLKEVRIIHGVGTGALRNHLIPFLNQHPLVQATRPGGLHQENPGVTIVEIATK